MDNQNQLDDLKMRLAALEAEYHLNNFKANQDFNKYSNFTTRLKVPHYDTLPTTCQIGEIAERSGALYICSAVDTWTLV